VGLLDEFWPFNQERWDKKASNIGISWHLVGYVGFMKGI
jgi:hypothetical protein